MKSLDLPLIFSLYISDEETDQLKIQMHLSGPVSGLCWIFSSFLRTSLSDTVHLLKIVF